MIFVLLMGYENKYLDLIREAYIRQKNNNFELLEFINKKGYTTGYCWNQLLKKAEGEWVLMTHTDCVPDYRLIDNYSKVSEYAVYAGSRFPIKKPSLDEYEAKWTGSTLERNVVRLDAYLKLGLDFESSNCPYYMISGSNFLAPKSFIEDIKFDEDLYAADWMMGLRLWKKGLAIKHLPQAIVYHIEHESKRTLDKTNNMKKFYAREKSIHGYSFNQKGIT